MIVAAKEKKHHCRSGAKFIEKNGSMQAQTDTSCMFPKTELNVVQMKRASTWPLPRDSVLVTCLPCWFLGLLGVRFLGCLTTTVSVIRVLAPGGCENFDASRTVSLIAANLGSKDFQSEVSVVAEKISKRRGCPVAGRSGALLGSGTGAHERHGWSLEVPDLVCGQKSENPQGGAQSGGYRWEQRPGAVVETGENAGR